MRVLITGGAGYLGRGILRRVTRNTEDYSGPHKLTDIYGWDVTVYSRDETKQDQCRQHYPQANYVLGDVRDLPRLTSAMQGHDAVIHAGAMKYIPDAELNAAECVSVNIDGTRNVITAAKAASVKTVVGISTDKAVQPVNIYGASKMVMERLFADEARMQALTHARVAAMYRPLAPSFACVRYGNVVGSTGSVLPLFARQYAETGKVKITDPQMTRFWMGVDEAIDLVCLAMERASNGGVVVPFTRAMTLLDAARAATANDVEVEIIGVRPGEKAHEMLMHFEESVRVRSIDGPDGKPLAWELMRPGSQAGEREPFTMASHSPNWLMSVVDMRQLLADAETV